MSRRIPLPAVAAIALALVFNVPYAMLAATYDYPQILRRPAGEALARFAEGGPALVFYWYAFAIAALALAPLAVALTLTRERLAARPGLAIGTGLAGVAAGVIQSTGLLRWVFAVPGLAAAHGHGDPAAAADFALLNAYAGVAIGEHLGQLLTAAFAAQLAVLQWLEGNRRTAGLGLATAAAIALGTGEGLALALGNDGSRFALATIAGFLGLTLWLIATGVTLLRRG